MEKGSFSQEYFVYFKKIGRISSGKDQLKTGDTFVRCCLRELLAAAAVVAAAATAAVVADSVAAAAAAEQENQDDDPPAVAEPVIVATHIRYLPTDICAAVCRADSSYSVGAIW